MSSSKPFIAVVVVAKSGLDSTEPSERSFNVYLMKKKGKLAFYSRSEKPDPDFYCKIKGEYFLLKRSRLFSFIFFFAFIIIKAKDKFHFLFFVFPKKKFYDEDLVVFME